MLEPVAIAGNGKSHQQNSVAATGGVTARIIRGDSLALCESELDEAIEDITAAAGEADPLRRDLKLSLAKCRIQTTLLALWGAKS